MIKYLLGTVFAALLLAPLAFTGQADQSPTNGPALAHCGSCEKEKCKEGCDCKKCKKKGEEKEDALLADCGDCKKDGCKKKKKDCDKDEALLADCGDCKKDGCKKKKKDCDKDEALLFVA